MQFIHLQAKSKSISIRIFVTGGTFYKEYNKITGQLFFQATHLPEMLSLIPVSPEVNVQTLMMIDSIEMTKGDCMLIDRECNTAT